MNFWVFLLNLINHIIEPATYEPIMKGKAQLLRLFSRLWGRNARFAAGIALPVLMVTYGWYRMQKIHPLPVREAACITWELPSGGVIPILGIPTTLSIDGGELIIDSATIRFVTHNNNNLKGCHMLNVPARYYSKLILPDGTVAQLNSGSRLQIPADFGCKKRELSLQGEGFFNIAPDARQLLTIHSGKADILALGTSLNINNFGGNMKAALVEGSIIVSVKDKKRQLKPGQEATIDKITGQVAVDTFQHIRVLGWLNGRYEAAGKTMEEVKDAIERWYNVKVVFDNPDLGKAICSGAMFRNQPLEVFLNNLKAVGYLVDYYTDNEGMVHLK